MRNSNFSVRIEKDQDKWVVVSKCKELPAANSIDSYKLGEVKEIEAHPMFGAKCKVSFDKTGPNSFKGKADTQTYGVLEWEESFSPEGMSVITTHKSSGASLKEFWPRLIKESRSWRFKKAENLKNFMIGQGIPKEMCSDEADATIRWIQKGSNDYTLIETWAGAKNVFNWKLDEECEYSWPGLPNQDRTILTTKVGNGKYKALMKGKQGQSEEWDWQFGENELVYVRFTRDLMKN